ncbi:Calx-beta domain-containing protein [Thiocystis violacea]|uniref:Calx-beta domain-containing protein n=1 Tax=Thiocystis violacea TaxID=13725 RepID=UPI00190345E2|nr:Calx-beta domain-containing protein [Thiocystis violacea]MBK1717505.1 hypothetical protein [Thiocystis violacea]
MTDERPVCVPRVAERPTHHARGLIAGIVALGMPLCALADIASNQFVEARNASGNPLIDLGGETWGASWGDLNGDGFPDLWLGMHQYTPSALLRSNGALSFTNVIDTSVINASAHYRDDTHGASWADFDNDGDDDLLEACGGGAGEASGETPISEEWRNNLFVNNGGVLSEQGQVYGVDYPRARGRTPLWLDYENDGELDVVIGALQLAGQYPSALFRQSPGLFEDVSTQTGFNAGSCENLMLSPDGPDAATALICGNTSQIGAIYDITSIPFTDLRNAIGNDIYSAYPFDLSIADFNGDLRPDIFAVPSPPNVAAAVRLEQGDRIQSTLPTSSTERGFSFTATGDVQVSFGWETETGNISLGANGVAPPSGSDPGLTPPNAWPHRVQLTLSTSDPNLIGLPASRTQGIYIGYQDSRWHIRVVNLDHSLNVSAIANAISVPQPFGSVGTTQGNTLAPILFENENGVLRRTTNSETFLDPVSMIQTYGRSVVSGDFDNDMDVDVYVGATGPVANVANLLFDNQGNGTFRVASGAGGAAGSLLGKTDVVTSVDYNRDGCLDLFVAQGGYPAPFAYAANHQLFRNQCSGNRWIQIDLDGLVSNANGIGAVLYASTPDGQIQMREQANGTHRNAQDFRRIHFGLGSNQQVDIEVHWPSGVVDHFTGLSTNQVVELTEGEGGASPSHTLAVNDVSVNEGPTGQQAGFTVTLSPAPGAGESVNVNYQTANGGALAGSDYTTTSGTLTFLAGQTTKTVTVPILNDSTPESTETFTLGVSSTVTNAATGTATILDDDSGGGGPVCGAPTYSATTDRAAFLWNDCGTNVWHLRVTGGGNTLYPRHLGSIESSQAFAAVSGFSIEANDVLNTSQANRIAFDLAVGGTFEDGINFTLASGATACFDLTSPTTLPVFAGATREPVNAQVGLPDFGACAGGATHTLGIANLSLNEGPTGQQAEFTVSLSPAPASGTSVSVAYQTVNGSAVAGSDYTATSGSLTFLAGQTTATVTVTVPILNDTIAEGTESFTLTASSPVSNSATGTGTILDDDGGSGPACGAPSYSTTTDRAAFLWNDCGTDVWHLRISGGSNPQYPRHLGSIESSQAFAAVSGFSIEANDVLNTSQANRIAFDLAVGGTFEDGINFTLASGASACFDLTSPTTLAVFAGADRQPVTAQVGLPGFGVCTGGATHTLGIANLSLNEGPTGQQAEFTVSLSPAPASGSSVSVAYQTVNGSAVVGSDYTATSGSLTFLAGQTTATVTVPILNDTIAEGTESFTLTASSPVSNSATGTGTILDDDGGSGPACGAPSYSTTTDRAAFLWNDCGTDVWHLRISGGSNPQYPRHLGSIESSQAFAAVSGFSIEANDVLNTSQANRIVFELAVGGTFEDGINFTLASGASACFDLTSPTTLPVFAGADRQPVDRTVGIPGFGVCTP